YDRELTAAEVAHVAGRNDLSKAEAAALVDYYLATVDAQCKAAANGLKTARHELSQFTNPIPEIMVMQEMKEPKPAYILKRGNYDQHGQRVTADTPSFLPPLGATPQATNRLELAKWL